MTPQEKLKQLEKLHEEFAVSYDDETWLISRIRELETALEETVGMWTKHGSFYSVSDHEAWLEKAQKILRQHS